MSSKSCLFLISLSILIGCNQDEIFTEPTVDFVYITSISDTSIIMEGLITTDGGTPILKNGVCWSTSENPTIANNLTIDALPTVTYGLQNNYFESSLIGLAPSTRYYLRAYATNKVGTSYGKQLIISTLTKTGSVIDFDGNEYTTVKIGEQTWMVENLKTTRFNDGTIIPNVTDYNTWSNIESPGYCWYNNDSTNKTTFGALYNWYTIETRKLAPTGWHVPSKEDWKELETYLISNGFNYDSTTTENKIAKSLASTTGWYSAIESGCIGYNLSTNNSSGFSANPAGIRWDTGEFNGKGFESLWWCSWSDLEGWAYIRGLDYHHYNLIEMEYPKNGGFSVRCVRNF